MIVYTIDAYSKVDENLLFEIDIPEKNANTLAEIMGLNAEDKADFMHGIGVYNINKEQAILLEVLLGRTFYSSDLTLQLSAGEI
ncbi:hypothetical protein [Klebsiella electrica]|uniref:DUF7683 domain-containing protein n=1 Tax=Klebsiella/Raoultella group TaxID=2890311 RepID=UPI000C28F9BE|nr:hypothetical protein [Klebsiella electrica]PJR60457.1 hypothetical protein CWM52_18920 [Raoultella sp. T31]QDI06790.1 hypothetical protein electrica_00558 [Klebsiella electrica]WIO42704.1 hypothetical protein P2G42_23140 [Klebsiella electrica]BBV74494.1 hypothetical protein STW0522RAO56_05480 [Raoultella planticola]